MTLLEMSYEQLNDLIVALGYPSYRTKQVWTWLYAGVNGVNTVNTVEEMTNLPLSLRTKLPPVGLPKALNQQQAEDGTLKVLWTYEDQNTVESVLMRYRHGNSACLSTQVGCKMGCVFCASCADGLIRQLSVGEIMGQYLGLRSLSGAPISRVVLMGMGEPLDNLDNVLLFLTQLREAVGLSMRHVSVSTCGLPDGIRRLGEAGLPVTLSVSLHAPDDLTRSKLMPVNRRYPVKDVLAACGQYFETTGRRISYEYIMIQDVNDTEEQARQLGALLKGTVASHVNLIACNPVPDKAFSPSIHMAQFQHILEQDGVTVTVRRRLGRGIDAACGQLRRRNSVSY